LRLGKTLSPVYTDTTTSEDEFAEDIPKDHRLAFDDGAFDAKPILNSLASKGYIPIIEPGRMSQAGYVERIGSSTATSTSLGMWVKASSEL